MVPGEDDHHEGDDAMTAKTKKAKQQAAPEPVAESDRNHWQKAVKNLIDLYFPLCQDAAVVVEPGGDLPPLVIPIAGAIPSCIDCTSRLRFSGHYTAAGC
jgi:hypothetical protein